MDGIDTALLVKTESATPPDLPRYLQPAPAKLSAELTGGIFEASIRLRTATAETNERSGVPSGGPR